MSDLNVVTLVGRVTKDAELRVTPGGMNILNFCIATNRAKKVDDKWEDDPNFFWLNLFGERAKKMGAYLLKGQAVSIIGELKQDRWESGGAKHSKMSLIIDKLQLIGSVKNKSPQDIDEGAGEEHNNEAAPEPGDDIDPDFDMGFNPDDMQDIN
jgi:single-strand DNA-binding protein